jgi:crotonobetainyl-CoA:carnitine CoA-transferase CaiB-like acyl-CoA transferase
MSNYLPSVATLGARVYKQGRGHAQIVPYQAFMCADGEYLMIGAFTRDFWHNLCRALGHEEWISDPKFASNPARLAHRAELVGKLEDLFATRPRAEWSAIMTAADVPNSPVYELHDAIHTEQVRHARALMDVGSGAQQVRMARSPIRVEAWGGQPAVPAPHLGADTRGVLRELLGMQDEAIDALAARQVVVIDDRGDTQ